MGKIIKTIHDLEEHESMVIVVKIVGNQSSNSPAWPYAWQVTRVATGWIYQDANPNIKNHEGYFVPLTYYTNPNP